MNKIASTKDTSTNLEQLKTKCNTTYKLADKQELELIQTVIDRPLPEEVQPNTFFGVASLTKPVLAYLVLMMTASGKYSHKGKPFTLETKLDDILPFKTFLERNKHLFKWREKPGDDKREAELTATMILSHTSGIDLFANFPAEFQAEPGKEYVYSGLGIYYLQQVIEEL